MIEHILADWPLWGLNTSAPSMAQVKTLPGGLTNRCFLLSLEGGPDAGQYVLRVEGKNSAALDINREAEYAVHQMAAAKGLTPAIVCRPVDKHYWIRRYVPGRTLTDDDLTPARIRRMLDKLQSLHHATVPAGVPHLSVTDKAGYYWDMLSAQGTPACILDMRAPLQQCMHAMPDQRRSLCHMDPLPANWIENDAGELILLDWEYAAVGHPLWDIAALFQAAGLSQEQEHSLLLDGLNQKYNASWRQAKRQMQYLSVLWYGAQRLWSAEHLAQELSALQNGAPAA